MTEFPKKTNDLEELDEEIKEETEEIVEEVGEESGDTIVFSSVKETVEDNEEEEVEEDEEYEDDDEDDDEEYEYVTPHYGLMAVLTGIGSVLVGALVIFLLTRNSLSAEIRQAYIDEGYVKTTGATATASDIAEGKTAYVNGELVVGTYVAMETSNATATEDDILNGYTGYVDGVKITGKISYFNPTTSGITAGTKDITIAEGYYIDGYSIIIKGDDDLKAENIKEGVTIFGVTGTY